MSAHEILPRQLWQVGYQRWRGMRTILIEKDAAVNYSRSVWNQPYPGFSGWNAPIVTQTRITWGYRGVSTVAAVTLIYNSPTYHVREPGKARLFIRTLHEKMNYVRDLDDKIIVGPDPDGKHFWQLYQGSNIKLRPYAELKLETAFRKSDFRLGTFYSLVDGVNHARLPNFGNAAPQTIRVIGVVSELESGNDLVPVDMYFQWEPAGWNRVTQSVKGTWVPVRKPVFKLASKPNAKVNEQEQVGTQDVLIYVPGAELVYNEAKGEYELQATRPEPRRLYRTVNLSVLDRMIAWT